MYEILAPRASNSLFAVGAIFPGESIAIFPGEPIAIFPGEPIAIFPGEPIAIASNVSRFPGESVARAFRRRGAASVASTPIAPASSSSSSPRRLRDAAYGANRSLRPR